MYIRQYYDLIFPGGMIRTKVGMSPTVDGKKAKAVSFTNIHVTCKTPLKQPKHCNHCGVDVEPSDVAHGYAYGDGFVVITDEELARSLPKRDSTIEITKFVHPFPELDSLRINSFWLVPNRESEFDQNLYATMRAGMTIAGLLGIGSYVSDGRYHSAVLEAVEQGFVVHTLRSPDELREVTFKLKPPRSTDEVKFAVKTIKSWVDAVEPKDFSSPQKAANLAMIHAKLSGVGEKDLDVQPREPLAPVTNLMDTLKQSVREFQQAKPKSRRKKVA